MSFAEIASIIAGLSFAISSFIYVRDTAKAKITPSIVTFGILSIVNFSQLLSLIAKEVWFVVPFTIVGFLQAIAVFIIALRSKRFYFKLLDKIALLGALIGIGAWLHSGDAVYNIYIVNIVIALAFLPLIVKAFREPALETRLPWQVNLFASAALLFTITSPAVHVWIVPARQFICSLLVNIGITMPSTKAKRPASKGTENR